MNNEMLKMTCEYCGAPLNVKTNSSYIKCDYCGHIYLVPKLIENYARCPLCGRNDRVTKVSLVKKNRKDLDFGFNNLSLPHYEYKEIPPLMENSKTRWFFTLGAFSLLFVISFILNGADQPFCFTLAIIGIIIGFGGFFSGFNKGKSAKKYNAMVDEKMKEAIDANNDLYRRLKPIYERIYYCDRDDIIFLPNEGDYASPENLIEYLIKQA